MYDTGSGRDHPSIVRIDPSRRAFGKFGASLTFGSGVLVKSIIQTALSGAAVCCFSEAILSEFRKLHDPTATMDKIYCG